MHNCEICKQNFKSIQGLLGHQRMKHLGSFGQHSGQQRRPSLGRHGTVTCEEARKLAKNMLGEVVGGGDPSGKRQEERKAETMSELCDLYLEGHAEVHNKPRTVIEARRIVEQHVRPALGRIKVRKLTRREVEKLHEKMRKTPRNATMVMIQP